MKIYAPVKDTNGIYASVLFVNGVGETDNPYLIQYFKEHGYKVPIDQDEPAESTETVTLDKVLEEVEPSDLDFDAMTPLELREYMREHGYGYKIKNTRDKEKLLKILRG